MTENILQDEKQKETLRQKRYRILMLVMLAVMICAVFFSFWVGYYPLTPYQVTAVFFAGASEFFAGSSLPFGETVSGFFAGIMSDGVTPQAVTIFWNIRLPRILSAIFIGASLSVAGSSYQGMLRNPLVSPDILGVSSGASLGAAIAILSGSNNFTIQISAFAGGILAVASAYIISRKSAYAHTLSLVLSGSMIMALCNAGVTMIKYIADPNDVLQQITFWLMGSLTKTTMESFYFSAVPMLIGLITILALRWRINLLTLDDEEAKSLGVNVKLYRLIFIAASTLLSASAVCLGGLIGWVGLMMPHIARAFVGVDYSRLIPASAMLGAAYLVLMDDLARSILSLELPLGVVTSVMGAPFFIYLLRKRRGF